LRNRDQRKAAINVHEWCIEMHTTPLRH
jgi:hypothetical protein